MNIHLQTNVADAISNDAVTSITDAVSDDPVTNVANTISDDSVANIADAISDDAVADITNTISDDNVANITGAISDDPVANVANALPDDAVTAGKFIAHDVWDRVAGEVLNRLSGCSGDEVVEIDRHQDNLGSQGTSSLNPLHRLFTWRNRIGHHDPPVERRYRRRRATCQLIGHPDRWEDIIHLAGGVTRGRVQHQRIEHWCRRVG